MLNSLKETIIADAFERRSIMDGRLAERLIRERLWAADEIERLTAIELAAIRCVEDGDISKLMTALSLNQQCECKRCGGSKVEKAIAGNGYHWCPDCQGRDTRPLLQMGEDLRQP